jgi:hypothetical protein
VLIRLVVIAGTPFCLAASLAAFLITYNEYSHRDKRLAIRIALEIAAVAFIAFAAIAVVLGFVLPKVIAH